MTTLAERLSQRSGLPLGSYTMSEHLAAMVSRFGLAVVAPYTVATVVVAYSGLPAGLHTLAEHLAVDRAVAASVFEVTRLSSPISQRVDLNSRLV